MTTVSPGANVSLTWDKDPPRTLGKTTDEGLLIRYPPYGKSTITIWKDTIQAHTIQIADFNDAHPATLVHDLKKQALWMRGGSGPVLYRRGDHALPLWKYFLNIIRRSSISRDRYTCLAPGAIGRDS